jgi:cytochrome c oxidase subunit IV
MNTTNNHLIEDPEREYDPTTYVPHTHSHGTKEVWMIFWVLFGLTLIDIAIYFMFPATTGRHVVFIALGVVKGFYIMGTFMHLKYEMRNLILAIVVPLIFIIWFVAWLIYEGAAIGIANYL